MGTACVSIDIPVACELAEKYPKAVLIAKNTDQFLEAISIARNLKDTHEAFNLADSHTWTKKVDIIERAIKGALNQ